jgi:hypothetical protein
VTPGLARPCEPHRALGHTVTRATGHDDLQEVDARAAISQDAAARVARRLILVAAAGTSLNPSLLPARGLVVRQRLASRLWLAEAATAASALNISRAINADARNVFNGEQCGRGGGGGGGDMSRRPLWSAPYHLPRQPGQTCIHGAPPGQQAPLGRPARRLV